MLKVPQIRGYEERTRIASAPAFIEGVTNLRGVIVPVVDRRIRSAVCDATNDAKTVAIILSTQKRVIAIVVDSVSDVVTPKPEDLRVAPNMGSSIDTQYVTGLATIDDRMLILVDIKRFMSAADSRLIVKVAALAESQLSESETYGGCKQSGIGVTNSLRNIAYMKSPLWYLLESWLE